MAALGSTVFVTHLLHCFEGEFIPRLNSKSQRRKPGCKVMEKPWFRSLARKAEQIVLLHLKKHDQHALRDVVMFKHVAPPEF